MHYNDDAHINSAMTGNPAIDVPIHLQYHVGHVRTFLFCPQL